MRKTVEKAALMALSDEVRASIIPQVIAEQCRYMPDLPAPIADDGWIDMLVDCPKFPNANDLVEVRRLALCDEEGYAKDYSWKIRGIGADIIAYRIISPAADRVGEP